MPYVETGDVKLFYVEAAGRDVQDDAVPVIFVHEFAGDHRSWEPQMRYFSRIRRSISYNARGYPPSDAPADPAFYSQEIVADDIGRVMDSAGIDRAHVVGLSMGGFATLHFGLRHPDRACSLVVAGCGYGAEKGNRARFLGDVEDMAKRYDDLGAVRVAEDYALGATRVQLANKDPRGWAEFKSNLAEHSAEGAAATLRGYLKTRPSLYDLEDQLRALTVPTLVVTGDEDEPCLEPDLYLKRTIPTAGLWVMPRTGHTINIEEPGLFNAGVADFHATVEAGAWGPRDPRSHGNSMGVKS
jgi:pimeloyl-ACP methyl ester carboxylesterase